MSGCTTRCTPSRTARRRRGRRQEGPGLSHQVVAGRRPRPAGRRGWLRLPGRHWRLRLRRRRQLPRRALREAHLPFVLAVRPIRGTWARETDAHTPVEAARRLAWELPRRTEAVQDVVAIHEPDLAPLRRVKALPLPESTTSTNSKPCSTTQPPQATSRDRQPQRRRRRRTRRDHHRHQPDQFGPARAPWSVTPWDRIVKKPISRNGESSI